MINPLPASSPAPPSPARPRHACHGAMAILCGGIIIGLLAGVAYLSTRPLRYRASALLLFPAGVQTAHTQVQSRELERTLVRDLNLRERWKVNRGSAARERLQRELHSAITGDNMLEISVTDTSAHTAGELLQATANALGDEASAPDIDRAKARLQEEEKLLNTAREALAMYQQQNPLTLLADPAAAAKGYRALVEKALRGAKMDAEARLRQAKTLEAAANRLIEASKNPAGPNPLANALQRVIDAETDLALAQSIHPPESNIVLTYRNDLDSARRHFNTELQRQLLQINAGGGPALPLAMGEAALARLRVQGLQEVLGQLHQQIKTLVAQQTRCRQLTADVAARTAALQKSVLAFEQATALAEMRQAPFRIVDSPQDPAMPLPRFPLDVLALFAAGGLGCSMIVFALRRLAL
ncbi:MAG: GumC domain-containing protein [Armatimonadota bacterium]